MGQAASLQVIAQLNYKPGRIQMYAIN